MSETQGNNWTLVNEGGGIKAVRRDDAVGGVGEFGAEGEMEMEGLSRTAEVSAEGSTAVRSGQFGDEENGLSGSGTVLGASGEASASASAGADGVEVKAAAGATLTLVGGKLNYVKSHSFTILGQQIGVEIGAELSAEVVAEANGEVGIEAKQDGDGLSIEGGAGVNAFAGARAGFKLGAKITWESPDGEVDLVAAEVGASGFAGAAAVAEVSASLSPCIEFSADIGLSVGLGGGLSGSIKMNPVAAAKLGFTLAARGIEVAWEGLKDYGEQLKGWLEAQGERFIDAVGSALDGVISGIGDLFSGWFSWW